MIGGEAFLLLKTGRIGPETAKQAEIRLAILLKIVQIAPFWGAGLSLKLKSTFLGCGDGGFRGIWLIYSESFVLLF